MFSATDCHGPGMSYRFECSNVPVSAMCWDQEAAYDRNSPTGARAGRPTDARRLLTSETNWDSAEGSYPATRCGSVVVVVVGVGTVVAVVTGGAVVVVVGAGAFAVAATGTVVVVVTAGTVVVVVGATVVVVVVGTTVVEVVVNGVDDGIDPAETASVASSGGVVPESPNAGTTRTAVRIATNASTTRDNDRGFMRASVRGQWTPDRDSQVRSAPPTADPNAAVYEAGPSTSCRALRISVGSSRTGETTGSSTPYV